MQQCSSIVPIHLNGICAGDSPTILRSLMKGCSWGADATGIMLHFPFASRSVNSWDRVVLVVGIRGYQIESAPHVTYPWDEPQKI